MLAKQRTHNYLPIIRSIVKKFNGEDIESISPTLGFNIKTLEYNGFTLNFWDVGMKHYN